MTVSVRGQDLAGLRRHSPEGVDNTQVSPKTPFLPHQACGFIPNTTRQCVCSCVPRLSVAFLHGQGNQGRRILATESEGQPGPPPAPSLSSKHPYLLV